jgi:hypothetical protein
MSKCKGIVPYLPQAAGLLSGEPKPLNIDSGLPLKEIRPGVHCLVESDLEAANIAGDNSAGLFFCINR